MSCAVVVFWAKKEGEGVDQILGLISSWGYGQEIGLRRDGGGVVN